MNNGKGSNPRPFSVSQQEYDTRWDAIFCRDLPTEPKEEYRVNKQGQTERLREGQWEIDTSSRND
jgi:hypothetical protein